MTTKDQKNKESLKAVPAGGSMFLYEKPEYLSPKTHPRLGWKTPEKPYSFAKKVNSIPLVASEIPSAQKHYPIIFPDLEKGGPIAVFSTEEGKNPFVSEDGMWLKDCYIPAYLRRYPIATVKGDEGKVAIVVDRSSDGIMENAELQFFEGDKLSAWGKSLVDFSVQYEQDIYETQLFMEKLRELNLLTAKHVGQTIGGEDKAYANFISIDGDVLKNLSNDQLLELNNRGYLAIIFGQLFSQENWSKVIANRSDLGS
ncbi:MAG: hypothetical protein CMK41_06325 [Porticoccaceae bacterium]|nr:hypothetical protein [Porticoccaceae bacterium]|tara:strand:+ start:908 stop:1675 length:768 start_codon:yes stop_codon:yes gene_type:complete